MEEGKQRYKNTVTMKNKQMTSKQEEAKTAGIQTNLPQILNELRLSVMNYHIILYEDQFQPS